MACEKKPWQSHLQAIGSYIHLITSNLAVRSGIRALLLSTAVCCIRRCPGRRASPKSMLNTVKPPYIRRSQRPSVLPPRSLILLHPLIPITGPNPMQQAAFDK